MCEDIAGGLEDVPIPATNLVDDPPVAPSGMLLHNEFHVLLIIAYSFLKIPKLQLSGKGSQSIPKV